MIVVKVYKPTLLPPLSPLLQLRLTPAPAWLLTRFPGSLYPVGVTLLRYHTRNPLPPSPRLPHHYVCSWVCQIHSLMSKGNHQRLGVFSLREQVGSPPFPPRKEDNKERLHHPTIQTSVYSTGGDHCMRIFPSPTPDQTLKRFKNKFQYLRKKKSSRRGLGDCSSVSNPTSTSKHPALGWAPVRRSFLRVQPYKHFKTSCPWVGPRCGGCSSVSNPTSTSKHLAPGLGPGAEVAPPCPALQAPQNILPWGRAPVQRSFLRAEPYKHLKTSCPGVVPRCEGRFSVPNLTSTSKHPALGLGVWAPVRELFLRAQPYKHLKTSCPGVGCLGPGAGVVPLCPTLQAPQNILPCLLSSRNILSLLLYIRFLSCTRTSPPVLHRPASSCLDLPSLALLCLLLCLLALSPHLYLAIENTFLP